MREKKGHVFGQKKGKKPKNLFSLSFISLRVKFSTKNSPLDIYIHVAIENEHVCIHDRIDAHFVLANCESFFGAEEVLEHAHGILGDVFLLLFVFVVVRDETIYEIECREKRARGERRERKRDGSFSESDRGGTN